MTDLQRRRWTPGRPLDVLAVIGDLRRGPGDPTFRRDPDGTIWRGIRTPQGPSTLRLGLAGGPGIEATAWGPGAEWVLTSVPAMLGEQDDPTGFVAHHPKVAEAARRFSGWRVPRTGLVLEALVPSIIEQKVAGQEAFGSFRTLSTGMASARLARAVPAGCGSPPLPAPGRGYRRGSGCEPGSTVRAPRRSSGLPVLRAGWSSAWTSPAMRRIGDCAPYRGSGYGLRQRCGTRPSVTPMQSASATTTWPRTSAGR